MGGTQFGLAETMEEFSIMASGQSIPKPTLTQWLSLRTSPNKV